MKITKAEIQRWMLCSMLNEERGNMYWKKEEDTIRKLCKEAWESLEHMLHECKELKGIRLTGREILKGEEKGTDYNKKGESRKDNCRKGRGGIKIL